MGALLCLITDLFVFVESAVKFALLLILLTADHGHICISVAHFWVWAHLNKPGVDHSFDRFAESQKNSGWAIGRNASVISAAVSNIDAFFLLYMCLLLDSVMNCTGGRDLDDVYPIR
ncbi:hypothetical protein ILYODFUR_019742 [Ilyodon furcidens]|uniref:Uncharacterized protein n=1 Tax=Ilyodon furcidens TaxID=33524 RepID=A0ABV0TL30_9TELE